MGVYAETHFEINCKSAKTAKKVLETLKNKETDENGNTFGSNLEIVGKSVCGYEDSGRIQNLEYRCEQIWEAIKDIEGVIDMEAPFLEEADGMHFEVESN
jgi:hypothetical protein